MPRGRNVEAEDSIWPALRELSKLLSGEPCRLSSLPLPRVDCSHCRRQSPQSSPLRICPNTWLRSQPEGASTRYTPATRERWTEHFLRRSPGAHLCRRGHKVLA